MSPTRCSILITWMTPKQPEPGVNWCAIGVLTQDPDAGPYLEHKGTIDGSTDSIRHEGLRVLASFYGPNAQSLAGRLRDGLGIPQNLETINEAQIVFVSTSTVLAVPALVNQQWIRGYDVPMRFRRKVVRNYAIRNFASADVHLFDDTHVDETITVSPPTP